MDLINWHYGKTTTNALNIRKAPSLSAQRWNNVWPVARIALIKTTYTPDWYETIYRGQKAYVSAKYMDLLSDQVHESIPDRMMYMAQAELGRSKSIYFNGYNGAWCHRFADWLAMHAGLPPEYIPNTRVGVAQVTGTLCRGERCDRNRCGSRAGNRV